jgi:hypothetical protein
MAASNLVRWGGPAAVLGGVLVMVGRFFSDYSWIHPPLYAAGWALVTVGITGSYLYCGARDASGCRERWDFACASSPS